jgi:phosphoribosylaminoimidazolecarboxamide formyltransferase/IMP cyclohydrolase
LADRYCFEELGIAFNELEDEAKQKAIEERVRAEKGGLPGASMVSDAFFPFRDGVDVGIREGVQAVVQPGGAMNDWNVIEACNAAGVTMVFTGQRSFKH